mgnify:CR=1 FL=1
MAKLCKKNNVDKHRYAQQKLQTISHVPEALLFPEFPGVDLPQVALLTM